MFNCVIGGINDNTRCFLGGVEFKAKVLSERFSTGGNGRDCPSYAASPSESNVAYGNVVNYHAATVLTVSGGISFLI